MASALLLFHVAANAFLILEKLTASCFEYTSTIFRSLAIVFIANNPPTVALMSIERLWALSFTHLYFKYYQSNIIKLIPLLLWTVYGVFILVATQVVCPTFTAVMTSVCGQWFFLGAPVALFSIWSGISSICYIKIYKIIARTLTQRPSGWKRHGSLFARRRGTTGIVFAFLLTSVISLVLVAIAGWIHRGSNVEKVLIFSILIEFVNATVDPCLYVFWFQECRYILVEKLVVFCPRMKSAVEQMRIEVYDIVTVSHLRGRVY